MSISAVNSATTAATTTATTSTDRGMGSLTSEDFFKILVTELQQQDPLQPSKTSDMIGQVSQIRGIELSKQLTDTLSQISDQQRTAGTSDLLGKYVTATVTDDAGTKTEVSGVVTGVRFDSSDGAVLELDTGDSVLASDVTRITTVDATQKASSSAATKASTAAAKASTATTATSASTTDKSGQTAKQNSAVPSWLSLDAGIHL